MDGSRRMTAGRRGGVRGGGGGPLRSKSRRDMTSGQPRRGQPVISSSKPSIGGRISAKKRLGVRGGALRGGVVAGAAPQRPQSGDLRAKLSSSMKRKKQSVPTSSTALSNLRGGLVSKSARERMAAAKMTKSTTHMDIEEKRLASKGTKGSNNQAPTTIIINNGSTGSGIGNQVIVSNLDASVSQPDLLELFSDIGRVTALQSINSSTAMITFERPADALKSIAQYNNRFLDGKAMGVTLIPNPSTSTSTSSSNNRNLAAQAFRSILTR